MQQCQLCYRTHEDAVETCDCGGPLVRQTVPWLQRTVRRYRSPACPQCGRPMTEELTSENNGFGRVIATMRCANCQQWHEVQRVGLPYNLLLIVGVILFFFLLQASESTFLVKFVLGVVNLVLVLYRWLGQRDRDTMPSIAPPEAAPKRELVKNFAAWLDDASWRQGDQIDRPANDSSISS